MKEVGKEIGWDRNHIFNNMSNIVYEKKIIMPVSKMMNECSLTFTELWDVVRRDLK